MSSLKDKKSSKIKVEEPARVLPAEIIVGQFAGMDAGGQPLVDYPGNPNAGPAAALATAQYDGVAAGVMVGLMFAGGDLSKPIIIGLVAQPDAPAMAETEATLTLNAGRELVLQCGRASITLTRAGKVLIRGTYISTRSSGMNRITGGSVQIN